jgi:hypothetical protein
MQGPSSFHPFTQQQTMVPSFIHVNQQGSIIFPQPAFLPQYTILPYTTQVTNDEESEEEEEEEEEENNQFVFEQNNEETDLKSETEQDLMPDIFQENKL